MKYTVEQQDHLYAVNQDGFSIAHCLHKYHAEIIVNALNNFQNKAEMANPPECATLVCDPQLAALHQEMDAKWDKSCEADAITIRALADHSKWIGALAARFDKFEPAYREDWLHLSERIEVLEKLKDAGAIHMVWAERINALKRALKPGCVAGTLTYDSQLDALNQKMDEKWDKITEANRSISQALSEHSVRIEKLENAPLRRGCSDYSSEVNAKLAEHANRITVIEETLRNMLGSLTSMRERAEKKGPPC